MLLTRVEAPISFRSQSCFVGRRLNDLRSCRRVVEAVHVPPVAVLFSLDLMILFERFSKDFQLADARYGDFVLVRHQGSVEVDSEC